MNRTLDLAFTNLSGNVWLSDLPLVHIDIHHPLLSICLSVLGGLGRVGGLGSLPASTVPFTFFRRDSPGVAARLAAVKWDLLGQQDPDSMVDFYCKLWASFEETVAKKGYSPWYTKDIIDDTKLKKKFRDKYCKSHSDYHRTQHLALRRSLHTRVLAAERK